MKSLITTILVFLYGITSFSQLCEKHNTYYYLDSIYPKQINEYRVSYDSNENPIDTSLVYQEINAKNGQLQEKRTNFQQGLYISTFFDTLNPTRVISINNPFVPRSPFPTAASSKSISTEIIEYNMKGQITCHVKKYRESKDLRIFNFYNSHYKIIEQKIYRGFELVSSTYIEYLY